MLHRATGVSVSLAAEARPPLVRGPRQPYALETRQVRMKRAASLLMPPRDVGTPTTSPASVMLAEPGPGGNEADAGAHPTRLQAHPPNAPSRARPFRLT